MSVSWYPVKPVRIIGVIQWTGENWREVCEFLGVHAHPDGVAREEDRDYLIFHTLEGDQRANRGDWIVRRLVENRCGMRFSEVYVRPAGVMPVVEPVG